MQTLSDKKKCSLTGFWHNQHGSEIDLIVLDDARLTGTFKLRPIMGKQNEAYPLTGFINEDIISFCVNFVDHGSMTAWVGQFGAEGYAFETMWHMVADTHGHPSRNWKAVCTGSDTFMRGACPEGFSASVKPASHPKGIE